MDVGRCELPAKFILNTSLRELLVDLRAFSTTYQVYHGYICVVLCVFGIINNIFNIMVLTRPSMRTSINIILATIAICDTGTMSTYLAYVLHFYILRHPGQCLTEVYSIPWLYFILFHSTSSILLHTTSLWLAVLLAFMRLVVIRKHHMSHSFLDPKHVWKFMLAVKVPLVTLCAPIVFTMEVDQYRQVPVCDAPEDTNLTTILYTTRPSEMALNSNCLLLRVTLWINGIPFKLLPCILLAVLICLLLWTFSKARARNERVLQRSTMSQAAAESATTVLTVPAAGSRRRSSFLQIPNLLVTRHNTQNTVQHVVHKTAYRSRTTKMLSAILLIFLLTEIPQAVLATLSGISPSDIYFYVYPNLGDILDLLSLINSSVNFVLYCTMSSRFRSTFIQLFVPRQLQLEFRRWSASSNSEFPVNQQQQQQQRVRAGPEEMRENNFAHHQTRQKGTKVLGSPQIFVAHTHRNSLEKESHLEEEKYHFLQVPKSTQSLPDDIQHETNGIIYLPIPNCSPEPRTRKPM